MEIMRRVKSLSTEAWNSLQNPTPKTIDDYLIEGMSNQGGPCGIVFDDIAAKRQLKYLWSLDDVTQNMLNEAVNMNYQTTRPFQSDQHETCITDSYYEAIKHLRSFDHHKGVWYALCMSSLVVNQALTRLPRGGHDTIDAVWCHGSIKPTAIRTVHSTTPLVFIDGTAQLVPPILVIGDVFTNYELVFSKEEFIGPVDVTLVYGLLDQVTRGVLARAQ